MRNPKEIIVNDRTLDSILNNHVHWLRQDCNGWENMYANLCNVDLHDVDLCNANMRYINLHGANLNSASMCNADLYGANLSYANMHCADLCNATLQEANLCNATMAGADLRVANLSYANLYSVNLYNANLASANLYCANLCYANLYCDTMYGANLYCANLFNTNLNNADLDDADLRHINLHNAILYDAKNIPYVPYACPEVGAFIGFKQAGNYIVVLEILQDAKRLSGTDHKCRCDKAKVLEIQNMDGTISDIESIESDHDPNFIYRIGEVVSVDDFDTCRWNECSAGIHFFMNRQEAVNF